MTHLLIFLDTIQKKTDTNIRNKVDSPAPYNTWVDIYVMSRSVTLLIPCVIVFYDTLIDFLGHYSKKDRHKYKE